MYIYIFNDYDLKNLTIKYCSKYWKQKHEIFKYFCIICTYNISAYLHYFKQTTKKLIKPKHDRIPTVFTFILFLSPLHCVLKNTFAVCIEPWNSWRSLRNFILCKSWNCTPFLKTRHLFFEFRINKKCNSKIVTEEILKNFRWFLSVDILEKKIAMQIFFQVCNFRKNFTPDSAPLIFR